MSAREERSENVQFLMPGNLSRDNGKHDDKLILKNLRHKSYELRLVLFVSLNVCRYDVKLPLEANHINFAATVEEIL